MWNHSMHTEGRNNDSDAVSPVIAVMLMLVVTIIVAAVVTGFAGGLTGSSDKRAPSLSMDVKILNMGSWTGSGFYATITQVSEPIDTANLKIVTSWTATNQTSRKPITGGNTVVPRIQNIKYFYGMGGCAAVPSKNGAGGVPQKMTTAPFGFGPGIRTDSNSPDYKMENPSDPGAFPQQFGNYQLVAGTAMTAMPCGLNMYRTIGSTWANGKSPSGSVGYGVRTLWQYTGGPYLDPAAAVLGMGWENLRIGDKVNVKVIYVPTGKVIFNKDIPVTEA